MFTTTEINGEAVAELLRQTPLTVQIKQPSVEINGAMDALPLGVDLMGNQGLINDIARIADALERIAENFEDRG